jgi:Type IV secretion system pilin
MIQKIKKLLVITVASLSLLAPGLLTPVLSGAASADIKTDLCNGAQNASGDSSAAGCSSNANASGGLEGLARTVTEWFSIIVGAISVIMIIYGGFRYITSGGDSGRVGNAKNTLIYAIVGLVIVALAQLIVNFVLTQATNSGNTFQSG